MIIVLKTIGTRRGCSSDTRGGAAVEMALLLPFLLTLLFGIIDFAGLFALQNTMTHLAHNSARQIAVGEASEDQVKSKISSRLSGWNTTFFVSVASPEPNLVSVRISARIKDAALIGFAALIGDTLSAEVTMRRET